MPVHSSVACTADAWTLVVDGLASGSTASIHNPGAAGLRIQLVADGGTAPTGAPDGHDGFPLSAGETHSYEGPCDIYAWPGSQAPTLAVLS